MTLSEFKETLSNDAPAPQFDELLSALWWQANDHWDKAHSLVQHNESGTGKWIHALLHRQEGDINNARYWYSGAGREIPSKSLQAEWEEIVTILLEK